MRTTHLATTLVVVLSAIVGQAQAGVLYGVTGDGASTPETLFILDQTDASASFVMTLGNGADGETIGFNPDDGLLYHASGISDGDRFWESIDLDTATLASSSQIVISNEGLAMTYNANTQTFLLTSRNNSVFYDTTTGGVATDIGSTPENLKGLAFVGNTLFGAALASDNLYTLNPSDGSVISSVDVTLDGDAILGMNGLAFDSDTGLLWAIFRQNGGVRTLGTLDPTTGAGTSVGILSDNFAGIAFRTTAAPVPEPASMTLVGIATVGMGLGAIRRRRANKSAAV